MSAESSPLNDEITQLIDRLELGDGEAAIELFPLVYDELRRLAKWKLADEKAGHTLQPTALVNEAYVRLVGNNLNLQYESRKGFFVAAAEAMRHILVDSARRKLAVKRGGDIEREHPDIDRILVHRPREILDVHEALEALAKHDPQIAQLVKLHYFGGYSLNETAELLDVSRSTAHRWWVYGRAWLKTNIDTQRRRDISL
jgi:RNA polymerase sigma factor (TIGR02999 family)